MGESWRRPLVAGLVVLAFLHLLVTLALLLLWLSSTSCRSNEASGQPPGPSLEDILPSFTLKDFDFQNCTGLHRAVALGEEQELLLISSRVVNSRSCRLVPVSVQGRSGEQVVYSSAPTNTVFMAAIVVRIRTIGPIRTICPKWSNLWSEFDFWSEFSIDDTHA